MSPASSASSLSPFLTSTSRVRGKATRRSPIAVSPRMFSIVILYFSLANGSTGRGCRTSGVGAARCLVSALFGVLVDLTGLAGLALFSFLFFAFEAAPLLFETMWTFLELLYIWRDLR